MEHSVHQEECRQLLSLAVVHPAFPPQERNVLHHWLSQLDKSLGVQERQQATNSFMSENPDVLPNTGCENLVRQNYMRGRMNGWRNQQLVHVDSGHWWVIWITSNAVFSSLSFIIYKKKQVKLTHPAPTCWNPWLYFGGFRRKQRSWDSSGQVPVVSSGSSQDKSLTFTTVIAGKWIWWKWLQAEGEQFQRRCTSRNERLVSYEIGFQFSHQLKKLITALGNGQG